MNTCIDDLELFFTRHGQGRPMLVMHGGLGWDHSYLRPGLDELGGAVELVYYDHRGNGRSQRPEEWEEVSHETWIDDADALREHLGYERILLFGHSYGGFLAQEYALAHPERVEALILCSTAPALDFPEAIIGNAQARGTPEQVEAILGMLSAPVPDDSAMRDGMDRILPLYFHDPARARGEALFRAVRYSAGAFNHAFGRCAPTFNTLGRLERISAPTLVLVGRHDWIMPPEPGAERLHARIPNSEIFIFEESGHFPWHEEPEAFSSVVSAWVARVTAREG